jgi:hypothetical protein
MLHLDRDHDRWYLVTSGIGGRMKAIPVINDDDKATMPSMIIPIGDGGGQASIN